MFSIGAFSRLVQLSVRVLRHYDEIGLLKPAHVSRSNGYRYYTAEQLADVHRIIALKDLGLTLEQVRTLVVNEEQSIDAIAGMLRLEKLRAEQERNDVERRLRDLDRRLAELTESGRLADLNIVEKSVASTPFLAYRERAADMSAAVALMNEVAARCEPLGPWSPLIGVAYDEFLDTENFDIELGYAVARPLAVNLGGGRQMTLKELPAVARMLSVIYLGTQQDGHRRCHSAIALWLERHGAELAGPGRELFHSPSGGAEQQTIEIQYPITDLAETAAS